MVGAYHVVCHECAFEGIFEGREAAESERDAHADAAGHDMSLQDISEKTPASPTEASR